MSVSKHAAKHVILIIVVIVVVVVEGYFRFLERASGLDAQSPGSSSDVLEYLKYSDKFLKDSDNSRHFTPGLTRLFFRT